MYSEYELIKIFFLSDKFTGHVYKVKIAISITKAKFTEDKITIMTIYFLDYIYHKWLTMIITVLYV